MNGKFTGITKNKPTKSMTREKHETTKPEILSDQFYKPQMKKFNFDHDS